MTGTLRTPINRQPRPRITQRAGELFERMRRGPRCTCAPGNTREDCPGCERWWDLQDQLHIELHAKPWVWPVIARSYERCGAEQRELWDLLSEVARANRMRSVARPNGPAASAST